MYILVSVALAALLGAAVITAQIRRRSKLPSAEPKTGGMTKVEMLDPQTEGLRKYVKEMQNLGKTQQEIRATLVQAGWTAGVAERIAPDTVENVASSKTVT